MANFEKIPWLDGSSAIESDNCPRYFHTKFDPLVLTGNGLKTKNPPYLGKSCPHRQSPGGGPQQNPGPGDLGRRLRGEQREAGPPGVHFMKLHVGLKVFGQIFYSFYVDKFTSKDKKQSCFW
jgi:hypothetical protein